LRIVDKSGVFQLQCRDIPVLSFMLNYISKWVEYVKGLHVAGSKAVAILWLLVMIVNLHTQILIMGRGERRLTTQKHRLVFPWPATREYLPGVWLGMTPLRGLLIMFNRFLILRIYGYTPVLWNERGSGKPFRPERLLAMVPESLSVKAEKVGNALLRLNLEDVPHRSVHTLRALRRLKRAVGAISERGDA